MNTFLRETWTVVKIIATIIAWLGLLVVLLGALPGLGLIPKYLDGFEGMHRFSPYPTMYFGDIIMIILASCGTVLALIGGLVARPRYFGQSVPVIGALYLVGMLVQLAYRQYFYAWEEYFHYSGDILLFLPGLVCIMLGIAVWCLRKRRSSPKLSENE